MSGERGPSGTGHDTAVGCPECRGADGHSLECETGRREIQGRCYPADLPEAAPAQESATKLREQAETLAGSMSLRPLTPEESERGVNLIFDLLKCLPVAVPGPAAAPADPVVSPADTPDELAVTIRRAIQVPEAPESNVESAAKRRAAYAALAALLAVGERDRRERDLYKRQLDAVDKNLPWEDEPGGIGVVGRIQAILNLKADRERGERDRRQIARLTEFAEWIAVEIKAAKIASSLSADTQLAALWEVVRHHSEAARAVLADEEDARPGLPVAVEEAIERHDADRADEALAALCEATREDVQDLEAFSGGVFDCCPVCGKLANEHPPRAAGEGDT